MAQRIPIICGNRRGIDHFQWPVKDGTFPVTTGQPQFPIGVDLEKALRWFWRVRRWNLNLAVSQDIAGHVNEVDPVTHVLTSTSWSAHAEGAITDCPVFLRKKNVVAGLTIEADRESDIVTDYPYANFPSNHGFGIWDSNISDPIVTSDGSISGGSGIDGDISWIRGPISLLDIDIRIPIAQQPDPLESDLILNYDPDSGLFYPLIEITVSLTATWRQLKTSRTPVELDFFTGGIFAINKNGESGYSSVGSIDMDGESTDVFCSSGTSFSTDFNVTSFTSTIGAWTLTPLDYWEFENRAGQLVYDDTDGSELHDPFD